jgi:hypothetical protein
MKVILSIVALVFVTFLSLAGLKIYQLERELKQARVDFIQRVEASNLVIGQAATAIADANKLKGELSKEVQDAIKAKNAALDMYASLVAKYQAIGKGKIDTAPPTTGPDGKLTSLPFQFHDFRLDVKGDAITKDFEYTLHQRFELKFAETKLSNGSFNHYAELYELDPAGKQVGKLELTKFNVVRSSDEPKAHFQYWNPRVDIGIGAILSNSFTFDPAALLGISLMGYGPLKSDLSWRFIRIGLELTSSNFGLSIAPAQYNVASKGRLFHNVWLTPAYGYHPVDQKQYITLGITATL